MALVSAGPFVSVLLSRMENMLSNPLHVNLLLTGILAQLAAYPQPLLRSFLLNTNLVFQPTVRSLYQVTTPLLYFTRMRALGVFSSSLGHACGLERESIWVFVVSKSSLEMRQYR